MSKNVHVFRGHKREHQVVMGQPNPDQFFLFISPPKIKKSLA